MKRFLVCGLSAAVACFLTASAQTTTRINPAPFADNAHHWYDIADKHNVINPLPGKPKYEPSQIKNIADNILLLQKENGGWPKNYDPFAIFTEAQKDSLVASKSETNTTFDNGSTYTHIEALSVAFAATGDNRYKEGAQKGFKFILKAQYSNGGWPQYYPLENGYSRHITYNDGAMIGIMELLKDAKDNKSLYGYLSESDRKKLVLAFDKGLDCILKTQIKEKGKLYVWCQQHDENTLAPAWARKFEPPCICNGESAGLVLFLMSLENPGEKVINSVKAAVNWFEQSKILNTRVATVTAPQMNTEYRVSRTDRVVVTDTTAPPIWTRYYELGTHRPMFCNRDSKVVYSLAEVERERRDGYAWYIYAPQQVLNKYPEWLKSIGN